MSEPEHCFSGTNTDTNIKFLRFCSKVHTKSFSSLDIGKSAQHRAQLQLLACTSENPNHAFILKRCQLLVNICYFIFQLNAVNEMMALDEEKNIRRGLY